MKDLIRKWNEISLVKRILVGLIIGITLALTIPEAAAPVSILGNLFVGALKAVAPILVFFLVMGAIAGHKGGKQTNMKSILVLYLVGTFLASVVAVIASFMFPVSITLAAGAEAVSSPGGISEVLLSLLMNIVDNPVKALMNANYIGILAWAILLGFALKSAGQTTKSFISDLSEGISKVVKWVISLAPFGILGLVFDSIATSGLDALLGYGKLLVLLVGSMLAVALIINPLIVYIKIRKNPYPLVLRCLRESGITAFLPGVRQLIYPLT